MQIQKENNPYDAILISLQKQLSDTNIKLSNIMKAIEAGIITASTKERLNELERQKFSLETEIKQQKMANNLLLTEEQIIYVLNEFYQKRVDKNFYNRIIDGFVHKVYLYKDKISIVYNLTGNGKELLKSDIDNLYKSSQADACGSPYDL